MPSGDENPPSENPGFEQDLVELINAARMAEGVPPLKRVDCLDRAARYHAIDMKQDGYLDHSTQDPGGIVICSFSQRLAQFCPGITPIGDLIGAGYAGPQQMSDAWLGSAQHRAVLMQTNARETGVGFCTGGIFSTYWVQDFGRHSDFYPVVINGEAESTTSPLVSLYIYGGEIWTEMRLRNDGEGWGAWTPFQSSVAWELRHESGTREVWVGMRNATASSESMDSIGLAIAADASHANGEWPTSVSLEPCRPNPFRSSTTIVFSLPVGESIAVRVHDVAGRVVSVLEEGFQSQGQHAVSWDGTDDSGRPVPAGVYFSTLTTPTGQKKRTIILVR
jgi:hypothetical protein